MKLLTKEILNRLPEIGRTDGNNEAKAVVKFFDPCGSSTWWAFEYDPIDKRFFGVALIHEKEVGYFMLDDLENYQGPLGLGIERDLHYDSETIHEIMGWSVENA